jgi:hypothetical protein
MDMIDLSGLTFDHATAEELDQMIVELGQYRDRLVADVMAAAQRAKIMKTQAQSSLEPNLAQIDTLLATLRDKHAALTAGQ